MSFPQELLGSFISDGERSPVIGVAWMTKEEQIEQDPFKGNGVRLDINGTANPSDLTDTALDLFGLPCTAWDCCVWIDLSDSQLSPDDARKIWEDMIRSPDLGAETAGERGEHSRADQRRIRRAGSDGDLDGSPAIGEIAHQ